MSQGNNPTVIKWHFFGKFGIGKIVSQDDILVKGLSQYLITSVILRQIPCFYINTSISFLCRIRKRQCQYLHRDARQLNTRSCMREVDDTRTILLAYKIKATFFYSLILQIFFLTFGPRPASNCLLHNLKNWHLFVFRFRVET